MHLYMLLLEDGVPFILKGEPMVVGNQSASKRMWPEVVGLTPEEAEKKIKEDMPMAIFQVVQPDCFVTMDYNQHRVRLFINKEGKVARASMIG